MNLVLSLDQIVESDRSSIGGKGFALSAMMKRGMNVPPALCFSVEAYNAYAAKTGLRDQILLQLHRKRFEDMRWEEIWDTALRIRSLFLKTAIPVDLRKDMVPLIESKFSDKAVVVRSSAPGEDSSKASFAGLHESYVNVRGTEAILDHVRLVWASLWSDRALLYRQELGLDVEKSAMAVVVQEIVLGGRSGVVFGKNPLDETQTVIEAVYGLNQGLVDGTVEPDRWILAREDGRILSHRPANRDKALNPTPGGVQMLPLQLEQRRNPPIGADEVGEVYRLSMKTEALFGSPQDTEWTYKEDQLCVLQSRPITSSTDEQDERRWYLTLHRSLENLKALRTKIDRQLIPALAKEASRLAEKELSRLSDREIADEIEGRKAIFDKWVAAYRRDCIPFAHGMRLFGQVYNDRIRPADPFEFMDLLGGAKMVSLQRNAELEELSAIIRKDPQLAESLKQGKPADRPPEFLQALEAFMGKFGDMSWGEARFDRNREAVIDFLLQMAARPPEKSRSPIADMSAREKEFFSAFGKDELAFARELLDIGRASYTLRDDDNIYLGKVEGQFLVAVEEGKRRLQEAVRLGRSDASHGDVIRALRDPTYRIEPSPCTQETPDRDHFNLRGRQLVGQPAGAGIAVGKARVILKPSDLFDFKAGEVLVCDAVDPNMTFVVPLAAGIVERRGGMLIHGAIIAREYGLPCVTGVPDVTAFIKTGEQVTVDGFLGIVIIGEATLRS